MIDGSCHIPLSKPIKVILSLGLRHLLVLTAITTAGVGSAFAAPTLRQGIAAMAREDYVAATAILAPIAQKGNPEAQAYMGYLYATGHGVPQDYTQAAIFYRRSAEQGYPGAQYELGLLYDKGQGVPQDSTEAEKWLILAAAGSNGQAADDRSRFRDAVATKLTRGELAQARMRALAFVRHPEH
jgi:TPR repeat protein